MYRKLLCLICVALSMCAFPSCGDDDEDITVDQQFEQALKQAMPGITGVSWEQKGAYKVAEGSVSGYEVEVWFDSKAVWAMTETDYNTNTAMLPDAVARAFGATEFAAWQIDDITGYERPDITVYEIEAEKGKQEVYLYYRADGNLVRQGNREEIITPSTSFSF